MSVIREDLIINIAINKSYALTDYNIHNNIHKQFEFQKQTILADESLTKDEKSEAIKMLTAIYDISKLIYNKGTRRVCENFEWIPYNNLKNIKYLTKGGYSEIYTAEWIDGGYCEWDSNEQQLKRFGEQYVVLKRLENFESANKRWFEEANSHLNISNKWSDAIVQCFGLTKDPLNGDYMLVMNKLNTDLRKFLQQNHSQLTWKERIQIAANIILAILRVHKENAIHRDLHSGNILFKTINNKFFISDLGFCGPAGKPLKSVYGNLPYIAPEVIVGEVTTFKSDIYSIGMLMWEISSGQPPFINYEHNYDLAMNIVNGIRPKIVSGTPLEYKNLMIQCWDANPSNRPDIKTLKKRIRELNLDYQNKPNELLTQLEDNNSLEIDDLENYTNSSSLFTSKVHQFENLPEPRNATEVEQEVFHSNKSYNFHIPNNIDDFDKLNNQKNSSKKNSIFKVSTKESLKGNSKNDIQVTMQQQIKKYHDDIDEDEIHNNPNLHSEEQDELVLPDNIDK
ncbi:kinase-like domain-containing protein [Rhizophagus diaphanus]|nr:kinase-like domain-containing protein [Rhizophagus diaphanus] [Rhizophagus sp. MUCL 43196]